MKVVVIIMGAATVLCMIMQALNVGVSANPCLGQGSEDGQSDGKQSDS